MGTGSSSLSKSDIATKNIVEVMSKAIQNCQGNTVISQRVAIIGNNNVVNGVRMVQGLKLSSACILEEKNLSDMQQVVANAIKQASDAQGDAVFGGLSKSSSRTITEIENETRAVVNRETVQNIINNYNAAQDFYLNGNSNIVKNVYMEQSMDIIYQQCLATLSQMKSFQEATTDLTQTSKSTQSNFLTDIINSIFGFFSGVAGVFVFIFMMIAIIVVVAIKSGLLNGLFGIGESSMETKGNDGSTKSLTVTALPRQILSEPAIPPGAVTPAKSDSYTALNASPLGSNNPTTTGKPPDPVKRDEGQPVDSTNPTSTYFKPPEPVNRSVVNTEELESDEGQPVTPGEPGSNIPTGETVVANKLQPVLNDKGEPGSPVEDPNPVVRSKTGGAYEPFIPGRII